MPAFWSTLFESGEYTNLTSEYKDTSTSPIESFNFESQRFKSSQWFAINALEPNTKRSKDNVISYRNFLVEFDSRTLEDGTVVDISKKDQLKIIKESGIPWSTAVWSGGKSYHFIISLETPLGSQTEYNYVSEWLHNIMKLSDKSTKDCSRLSRSPGGTYMKHGSPTPQTLEAVKSRVPNHVFLTWLYSHEDCEPDVFNVRTWSSSGVIKKSTYIKTEVEAETHCNDKWPLVAGQKQGGLISWAKYLVGNTNLNRDQMIDLIARNDMGNNRNMREYERTIDRALAMLESNQ